MVGLPSSLQAGGFDQSGPRSWLRQYGASNYIVQASDVLTLVMMGGALCAPPKCFYFLPKISPPDQTLRPTFKLLILGLLYHDFFFLLKI